MDANPACGNCRFGRVCFLYLFVFLSMPDHTLLTPAETAQRLRLDAVARQPERVVLAMVRRGDLEGRRVGKYTLILASSVDRFIAGAVK